MKRFLQCSLYCAFVPSHSVVFAGFSAQSLSERLEDARSRVVCAARFAPFVNKNNFLCMKVGACQKDKSQWLTD